MSENNTPKTHSDKIAQRYTHRTSVMYYKFTIPSHYLKNYAIMFEHGIFPLINDHIHSFPLSITICICGQIFPTRKYFPVTTISNIKQGCYTYTPLFSKI